MAVEIDIGPIKVIVDQGNFGNYVKFQRGKRWISISTKHWLNLTKHLKKAIKEDFQFQITKDKEIKRTFFEGNHYISLSAAYIFYENKFYTFIHFNEENWQILLDNARKITHLLTNGKAPKCDTCKDVKFVISVDEKRREFDTILSKEKLEKVEEYNMSVQNQLGLSCTYCGGANYLDDIHQCHCHTFNCSFCSPENFCKDCESIIVCVDRHSKSN